MLHEKIEQLRESEVLKPTEAIRMLTELLEQSTSDARESDALNSGFTIRRLLAAQQSDNPIFLAGLERICEGLRLAGVPEG
ncbi:hypothetical protein [Bradyrhizobium sp. S3.2.12]|uniref:hypothetical protein n=1 Tax=Bradyrhizobium sp. S3.2.12 TaxID=3156387 RepID=UPI00339083D3